MIAQGEEIKMEDNLEDLVNVPHNEGYGARGITRR